MYSQSQWLDLYRFYRGIHSDYRLAKIWAVSPAQISQYRRNRLRLPLEQILAIADALSIEPIEIIAGLEMYRHPGRRQSRVKSAYFGALIQTIGQRMSLDCRSYYRRYR